MPTSRLRAADREIGVLGAERALVDRERLLEQARRLEPSASLSDEVMDETSEVKMLSRRCR